MANIPEITAATFEAEVLKSPVPVLVDLYAPWCGPCKVMARVLEAAAPQVEGRAKVVKINTDNEPELAAAFHVSGVPTLALVHGGKVVDGAVGVTPLPRILEMVEKAAAKNPANV